MSRSNNINSLEALQIRKAEVAALCKEKENEIGTQIDYISDNLGSIALRTFIGSKSKKEGSAKADIITLLVSEGVETALTIQQDPTHIKDKVIAFIKQATTGIINILVK
jgi:hypothetical protein